MDKVIFIDDDQALLDELEDYALSLGYECVVSVDGKDALQKIINDKDISIVCSDINMEGLDGISLLKEIESRFMQERPIVCVMVTGESTVANAVASMRHKAIDFLTKPVSGEEIAGALRRASAKVIDLKKALATSESGGSYHKIDDEQFALVADLMRLDADPNNEALRNLIETEW